MATLGSPRKDRRILNLAAEVAETRDRRVPGLLLGLKGILESAPVGSKDAARLRQEIWDYNLLDVLILVIKQDFSIVEGQWQTAARLISILSQICSGIDLSAEDTRTFRHQKLPDAIENMFLVARRIQARFVRVPVTPNKQQERALLLGNFKMVLDSLSFMAAGHSIVTSRVLGSAWLLQLLITDNPDTVIYVMDLVQKVIRANWSVVKGIDQKTLFSIMDELIYKLSVEENKDVGAGATKCVLRVCESHKPMVEILCMRYRGLRPLLTKWEGRGFSRDLKDLLIILETGNAQRADFERRHRSAVSIQAAWKGFIARKRLNKANRSFSKFQKTFRNRREMNESKKFEERMAADAEYRGRVNRKKIMREFRERQLHTIEILPASKVEIHLQNEQTQAATRIQKMWRGYSQRTCLSQRKKLSRQVHAAIVLQRATRRWLERKEKRQGEVPVSLRPPGLTDERRLELQQQIIEHRERNPPMHRTREEQEEIHRRAASLLNSYYNHVKSNRRSQHKREGLLARLDTDSELLALAPDLSQVTESDQKMYTCRSVPVATKARVNHMEELRILQLPWWKKLTDEFQDTEIEEEDFLVF